MLSSTLVCVVFRFISFICVTKFLSRLFYCWQHDKYYYYYVVILLCRTSKYVFHYLNLIVFKHGCVRSYMRRCEAFVTVNGDSKFCCWIVKDNSRAIFLRSAEIIIIQWQSDNTKNVKIMCAKYARTLASAIRYQQRVTTHSKLKRCYQISRGSCDTKKLATATIAIVDGLPGSKRKAVVYFIFVYTNVCTQTVWSDSAVLLHYLLAMACS